MEIVASLVMEINADTFSGCIHQQDIWPLSPFISLFLHQLTTQIYLFSFTLSTVYASLLRNIAHCSPASSGIVLYRVFRLCFCPIFVLSEENLPMLL